MSKEQLLQELADAYERFIETAKEAAQRGVTRKGDTWGPREIVAHLAGWEVIATVRVPHIAAGMAPFEEADDARQDVMDDAINATIVTMIGDQPLDTVCDILRRAYKSDIEMLRKLDEKFFQPGEYVYERTKRVIEHCQEHAQGLVSLQYPIWRIYLPREQATAWIIMLKALHQRESTPVPSDVQLLDAFSVRHVSVDSD